MEEKKYPKTEEGGGLALMMAEEPITSMALIKMETTAIMGEEDVPKGFTFPFVGPSTREEAIARIEEAEREIENGETYAWEDVLMEARTRIGLYAAEIN